MGSLRKNRGFSEARDARLDVIMIWIVRFDAIHDLCQGSPSISSSRRLGTNVHPMRRPVCWKRAGKTGRFGS
jgi:hypothetical protein